MPDFTVLAVPYFSHAEQSRTSFAPPLSMFMATAPPRLDPTTTCGWCLYGSSPGFPAEYRAARAHRRPPTAGQNDFQELRMRPHKHDDLKLIGVYDMTGSFIPDFPFDLNARKG